MGHKVTTVQQMRELIYKGEAKDPLVFLECVMSGQDPRRQSALYTLVTDIDNFAEGGVSASEWAEVVEMVNDLNHYQEVDVKTSLSASKALAEYLHGKRKHIEMTNGAGTDSGAHTPITKDEILDFKEVFNGDF